MKYKVPVFYVSVSNGVPLRKRTVSEHDSGQEAHRAFSACVIGSPPGNSYHDGVGDDLTSTNDDCAYMLQ